MRHALLSALAALPVIGCAGGPPGPCSTCPDVAGLYTLTRTVSDEGGYAAPVDAGEVKVLVLQDGAHLAFDYEGEVLKGSLLEDDSVEALAAEWVGGVQGLWHLTGQFTADGQRLSAQVVEIRPRGAPGGTCQVSAALKGVR